MTIQMTTVSGVNNNVNSGARNITNPVENIKNKYNSLDYGEKKICNALSGLAVLSLAGIGIAVGVKKGKMKRPKNLDGIKDVVDKTKKAGSKSVKASKLVSKAKSKDASKIAHQAGGQIAQGANYATVRKEATKNLDKNSKEIVKAQLAKARADRLQQSFEMQHKVADGNRNITASIGKIKNAGQGIQSATGEQITLKMQTAQEAAQNAKDKAKEVAEIVKQNPTHKNAKRARVAKNRAIKARLGAERVQLSGEKRRSQIALDSLRKEENLQQMLNNTTPERLLEGQRKMAENAQKTSTKAIQRRANRKMNTPGYQRALGKFQNYSKERLQGIIASASASPIEKTVASDLLAAGIK